jgi:hypothetical protein
MKFRVVLGSRAPDEQMFFKSECTVNADSVEEASEAALRLADPGHETIVESATAIN